MDTPDKSQPEPDEADALEADPLILLAGSLRDDPFWDEIMDSIRKHRREMDAQWDVPEAL